MEFYTGIHQPADCKHFDRSFVSINRLKTRKGDFVVSDWIMDSGAFTELNRHGCFRMRTAAYAEYVARWSRCGNMVAACAQDYMCEPFMFEGQDFDECYAVVGTKRDSPSAMALREHLEYLEDESDGTKWWELREMPVTDLWDPITVRDHQEWTVDRYAQLLEDMKELGCSTYILPVLQGYEPDEYVDCIDIYEEKGFLPHGAYVGVGSVCKRNSNAETVVHVLGTIKKRRPDLKLHGFGLKITALRDSDVRLMLHSSDSMAWSFAARADRNRVRKLGGDWESMPSGNDWRAAKAYTDKVQELIDQ